MVRIRRDQNQNIKCFLLVPTLMDPSDRTPLLDGQTPSTATDDSVDSFESDTSGSAVISIYDTGQRDVARQRSLSLLNGIAMVLGLQIGSGIFISPSLVAQKAGSVPTALLSWTIAGVLVWACASSYVELGIRMPFNGGAQEYLALCFNEQIGFVASWASIFLMKPCAIAILSLTIASYLCGALNLETEPFHLVDKSVAIIVLTLVVAVQCISNRATTGAANIFLVCKLLGVGFIIVMGLTVLISPKRRQLHAPHEPEISLEFKTSHYADAVLSALWAYSGWETVCSLTLGSTFSSNTNCWI